jgi:hypothetical protein
MANNKLNSPWGILGTPLSGTNTEAAIKKSELGWTVSKNLLYGRFKKKLVSTGVWGVFRDDNLNYLGKVGKSYHVSQNSEMFDLVENTIDIITGSEYDAAGSLFNGERVFASISLPFKINLTFVPHERSHCFLMFETSHDCSLTQSVKLMVVRNKTKATLPIDLGIKVKHTKGKEAIVMPNIDTVIENVQKTYDLFFERKVNPHNRDKIMKSIFGKKCYTSSKTRNQINRVIEIAENESPELQGSTYALFQAFNFFIDFERPTRKTRRVTGLSDEQIRVQSTIFYEGVQKKEHAYKAIMKVSSANSI